MRLARTVAPPQEDVITVGKIIDFFKLQRNDEEIAPEVFEFFKRLSAEELLSLYKKLLPLVKKPHEEYLSAFRRCQYTQDPIFLQEDWPFHALLAFLRGELNTMALSQLLLYDECIRTNSSAHVHAYHVSDSDLLYESLSLDQESQATLKRRLMELPSSEGYFFFNPHPISRRKVGPAINCSTCRASMEDISHLSSRTLGSDCPSPHRLGNFAGQIWKFSDHAKPCFGLFKSRRFCVCTQEGCCRPL